MNALSWAPSSDMGSLICEPTNAEKNDRKKRIVTAGNGNNVNIYEEGNFKLKPIGHLIVNCLSLINVGNT